jgi:hypothetical protein
MKLSKSRKFGLLVGMMVFVSASSKAQSCSGPGGSGSITCFVQYQTSDGYLSKCGFPEFIAAPDAPRFHYYQNQTTTVSHSYDYNWSFGGSGTGWSVSVGDGSSGYSQTISDGSLSGSRSHSASYTEYEHETGPSCAYTNSFTGGETTTWEGSDGRTNTTVNDNSGDGDCVIEETAYSYSYSDSKSVVFLSGAPYWGVADNGTTEQSAQCIEAVGPGDCGCMGDATNAAEGTNDASGYMGMGTDCGAPGNLT